MLTHVGGRRERVLRERGVRDQGGVPVLRGVDGGVVSAAAGTEGDGTGAEDARRVEGSGGDAAGELEHVAGH
eukprot:2716060-Rhodomonas_salina.1